MNKVFYNPAKKKLIEDISGKQTVAQIKKAYGAGTYEQIEYAPAKEYHTIKNNALIKKTKTVPVNQTKIAYAKLTTQTEKINFIAERMGLI